MQLRLELEQIDAVKRLIKVFDDARLIDTFSPRKPETINDTLGWLNVPTAE